MRSFHLNTRTTKGVVVLCCCVHLMRIISRRAKDDVDVCCINSAAVVIDIIKLKTFLICFTPGNIGKSRKEKWNFPCSTEHEGSRRWKISTSTCANLHTKCVFVSLLCCCLFLKSSIMKIFSASASTAEEATLRLDTASGCIVQICDVVFSRF